MVTQVNSDVPGVTDVPGSNLAMRAFDHARWPLSGLLVLCYILLPSLMGCAPRSCEEARMEYYKYLSDCELDYAVDWEPPCTDIRRQYYECAISCVKAAPCAAVRGDDPDGGNELVACEDYCRFFIEESLKGEETEQ